MLPSLSPPDPNETNWIIPVNESLECMPSDDEQQYRKNPFIYRVPASIASLGVPPSPTSTPRPTSRRSSLLAPTTMTRSTSMQWKEHKHHVLLRFLKRSRKSLEPFFESLREEKRDYADNDPIFSTHRLTYITPDIRRDMLMPDNQLPMLVLYRPVAVENNGKDVRDEHINELILRFYSLDISITGMGRCLHVVDVFRKALLMEPTEVQHELENMGPRLRGPEPPHYHGGRRHLVHVRQRHDVRALARAGFEVTFYVAFINNLIDNERDVKLLHNRFIIQNAIGSNKAVAKLFNSLCKEVTLESNSCLDAMKKNISKHCGQP
ncbi:hypothetical protein NL676_005604 [Syzygium grande]|nr:hypothetical protein NL676_005604 [Syzygium grande]